MRKFTASYNRIVSPPYGVPQPLQTFSRLDNLKSLTAGAIFVPSAIARPFRLCRVRMIPPKKIGGGDIAGAKAIIPLLASRGRGRFVRDKVAGQTQETGNVIFCIRFSPVIGYLIKLSPMFRRSFSSYSQSSDSGYITSGLPYCL